MQPPDKESLHIGEEEQSMASRRDATRAIEGQLGSEAVACVKQ